MKETGARNIFLERNEGRLHLEMRVLPMGEDLQILLCGGAAHIGAIAIADSSGETRIFSMPGHHEGEVAIPLASAISEKLVRAVVVTAGIHFPHITDSEIESVRRLCLDMTGELLEVLKTRANPDGACNYQ